MNIVCLGCSFTSGTTHDEPNWVTSLAKKHPEHTFFNLALAGSSILYSIWILEEFLKTNKPDLIIFQLTHEGRVTYYKDQELDARGVFSFMNTVDNYNYIRFPYHLVSCINYGTLNKDKSHKHPLITEQLHIAEMYYSYFSKSKMFDVEHRAFVHYAKSMADVCFYHKDAGNNVDGIITIEKVLGTEKFKEFVIDGPGNHFGQDGCDWQADFISKTYLGNNQ